LPLITRIFTNFYRARPSPSEKPARLRHSGGGWDEAFLPQITPIFTDFEKACPSPFGEGLG